MRILLAEDERELSDALTAILRRNHYSVDPVYDGEDALEYALDQNYDVVVLDIMMPGLDGLTVLRSLRARGVSVPVLLLTAKGEVEDRIAGLDAGADDYLPKPFHTGEFLARLRAMGRRKAEYTPNVLCYGDLKLDRECFELSSGGEGEKRFRLGSKEYQIMELLMSNPGRLISTEQFMDKIWGYDSDAEINVVWVYISYLRKKLQTLGSSVEIRASRGLGYTLVHGTEEESRGRAEKNSGGDRLG